STNYNKHKNELLETYSSNELDDAGKYSELTSIESGETPFPELTIEESCYIVHMAKMLAYPFES
ncbi:MAG: hypothetical protein LBE95_01285, partial [Holosporaceae bacterium]|nr:hypothetical protein [Holosporaceae bacterium]